MPDSEFYVRVEDLRLKENVPAGMDLKIVAVLIPRLRTTTQDWEPILVSRLGDHWRIEDGRHRFFASVIAGRADILCVEDV